MILLWKMQIGKFMAAHSFLVRNLNISWQYFVRLYISSILSKILLLKLVAAVFYVVSKAEQWQAFSLMHALLSICTSFFGELPEQVLSSYQLLVMAGAVNAFQRYICFLKRARIRVRVCSGYCYS